MKADLAFHSCLSRAPWQNRPHPPCYTAPKDVEGKIDDLAQMVAAGFKELRQELKGDINELREEMATATKADLLHLRGDIDIMLDRHIGTATTASAIASVMV